MTLIHFDTARFTPTGTAKVQGLISFRPTKRLVVGDELVLPAPFHVPYTGPVDVELLSPSADWAWEITVKAQGIVSLVGYYSPQGERVNYHELIALDPDTLEAGEPDPAWWAKVDQLIELGGTPGTQLRVGSGAPVEAARPGDLYLDVVTGTLYKYS